MGRPTKWSEEEAIKVLDDLNDWLHASEENLFIGGFLAERGFSRELVRLYCQRHPEFNQRYQVVRWVQEVKILDNAIHQKKTPILSIFLLKSWYAYTDRRELKTINRNKNTGDVACLSDDELWAALSVRQAA